MLSVDKKSLTEYYYCPSISTIFELATKYQKKSFFLRDLKIIRIESSTAIAESPETTESIVI